MGREKREPLAPALSIGVVMPQSESQRIDDVPLLPAPIAIVGNAVTTSIWIWAGWYVITKMGYRSAFRLFWMALVGVCVVLPLYYYPVDSTGVMYARLDHPIQTQDSSKALLNNVFSFTPMLGIMLLLYSPWPLEKQKQKQVDALTKEVENLNLEIQRLKEQTGVTGDPEIDALQTKLNQLKQKRGLK